MQVFEPADVERMIKLLADSADPTLNLTVGERKTRLVAGLMELVEADSWIWLTGRASAELTANSVPSLILDGGWKSEKERTELFRFASDPALGSVMGKQSWKAIQGNTLSTLTRSMVIDDRTWAESQVARSWREIGFDGYMISMYPLGDQRYSCIGLHRRVGRPDFGKRERDIVHVVFQQVDWLHRDGIDAPVNANFIELSPRERQVLMLLLGGDSRKLVALKLELSEHTVGDYLKELYRKFEVKSRGQLLSRFIVGSHGAEQADLEPPARGKRRDPRAKPSQEPKPKRKKKE